MRLQPGNERHAKLRYWAIVGKRGYALDVYPEEAIRYRANLRRSLGPGMVLLGKFATRQEAEQCVRTDLQRTAPAMRQPKRRPAGRKPAA